MAPWLSALASLIEDRSTVLSRTQPKHLLTILIHLATRELCGWHDMKFRWWHQELRLIWSPSCNCWLFSSLQSSHTPQPLLLLMLPLFTSKLLDLLCGAVLRTMNCSHLNMSSSWHCQWPFKNTDLTNFSFIEQITVLLCPALKPSPCKRQSFPPPPNGISRAGALNLLCNQEWRRTFSPLIVLGL